MAALTGAREATDAHLKRRSPADPRRLPEGCQAQEAPGWGAGVFMLALLLVMAVLVVVRSSRWGWSDLRDLAERAARAEAHANSFGSGWLKPGKACSGFRVAARVAARRCPPARIPSGRRTSPTDPPPIGPHDAWLQGVAPSWNAGFQNVGGVQSHAPPAQVDVCFPLSVGHGDPRSPATGEVRGIDRSEPRRLSAGRIRAGKLWASLHGCHAQGLRAAELQGPNRVVTYSETAKKSFDDPEVGHSMQGYYLFVEGFRDGWGDLDRDETISVQEAHRWAAPRAHRRSAWRQSPVLSDGLGEPLPLAVG